MSKRSDRAVAAHKSGFNCAQSVLLAFCDRYEIDERMAAGVASALGGGLRCGEVCGAASGAALVIGLKYGQRDAADQQSKAHCNEEIKRFMFAFGEKCGAVRCADLLGELYGAPTPEQELRRGAMCDGFIRTAVELLEGMGY